MSKRKSKNPPQTQAIRKSGANDNKKSLIINTTQLTQNLRNNLDISNWRNAIRAAESIYNPQRTQLYDIFSEIELDSHLSSVFQKRKASILKKAITFVRNGETDDIITAELASPWFHKFLNDCLDTIAWEYSLFQFYRNDKGINYDLITRKHVKPEQGVVTHYQTENSGIPYRNNPEFPNMLEVKGLVHLGLYCKAAQWIIYKRNGMGDYAQYVEIFGQPIREGVYDGYDDEAKQKLVDDLNNAGSSTVIVHPQGTSVNIIETGSKGSSNDLYGKLIEICNEELSKLVLGNTLTTQQGSSGGKNGRGNSQVHKEEEEIINVNDEKFILDVLNYEMKDIFANLGLNTEGGEFIYDNQEEVDVTQRILVDMQLSTKIPIGDDYWYETYGIPKPENYDELKTKLDEQNAAALVSPPLKGGGQEGVVKTNPNAAPVKNKKLFSFFA